MVQQYLTGKITLDEAVDEAIYAWLRVFQQTVSNMTLPSTSDEVTIADFQSTFKTVSEKTTASPYGMHYSIWRKYLQLMSLSKWLGIMMSLPYMNGFVSKR